MYVPVLQLIKSLVHRGLITTSEQEPYNFVDCEFQMLSSLDVNISFFFLDVNLSTKKQENRDGTNYE